MRTYAEIVFHVKLVNQKSAQSMEIRGLGFQVHAMRNRIDDTAEKHDEPHEIQPHDEREH